eukprot:scaffold451_cov121-Cylindrotheca_fusiformis.AAC.8
MKLLSLIATAIWLFCRESEATISASEVNRYWTDANEILTNLDQYQALWVRFHNCVWSECAVDDNDDDGEGRDGDENWYMNRVQQFCANAAYSLYGIPKNWVSAPFMGCTRGHYIDSFFTYNSSDVFLRSLGSQTTQIFDDDDQVVWGEGHGAAVCHVVGDGTSQSMGCTDNGKFGVASFTDEYCDGNYFSEIIQSVDGYNRDIQTRCHLVYGRNGWFSGTKDTVQELLANSWSCDVELYPKGCPDPYSKKRIQANALHAASKGWNPTFAYNNSKFRRPIRITAWIFLIAGIFFLLFSYRLSNKDRIKKRGGGLRGMILVAREDYENYKKRREEERREQLQSEYDEDNKVAKGWRRRRKSSSGKDGGKERKRRSSKKKKKKSRKSRSKSRDPEATLGADKDDGGGNYERYEEDWALPDVA